MKHMKKLVSLMLAAVMVLAMTVTVSAAEPGAEGGSGPAEITVTNATKDAIYTLYKVFDATVNDENPDDVRIAYTWPRAKHGQIMSFLPKMPKGIFLLCLTLSKRAVQSSCLKARLDGLKQTEQK